jgi:transposase
LRAEFIKKAAFLLIGRSKFIDESGVNLGFTRIKGRARPEQRVTEGVPSHSGKKLTLIAAIGLSGISAEWMVEGAMDGEAFETYIKQVLLPTLRRGDILLMDNLTVHKASWLEDFLQSHGVRLEYLPPYSPDLNPIELCWSKVKSILRSLKPRTVEDLQKALKKAFRSISIIDICRWFRHCGYPLH